MIKLLKTNRKLYDLAKIHVDSIKQTYVGIFDDGYLDSLNYEESYESWKQYYLRGDKEILIAEENGELVGFVTVIFFVDEIGQGILDRLHVKKNMQHQGIGKKLIAAAAGVLWNMGITSMQIGVIGGNDRAEALYRSLGAEHVRSYVKEFRNMNILHKRLVWHDINGLADKSFYTPQKYDYNQIYNISRYDFVLFGAGDYCEAFMKAFPYAVPQKIFDNDPKKWGELRDGVKVEKPAKANNIIIAAGYYSEIEQQLKELGCQNIVHYYPWHKYDHI